MYRHQIYDEFRRVYNQFRMGNLQSPPLQRSNPLFEESLDLPRSSGNQEVVLKQGEGISILDEGIYENMCSGFSISDISGTGGLDITYFFLYPGKKHVVDEGSLVSLHIEPSASRCIKIGYGYISMPDECTVVLINPQNHIEPDNDIFVAIRNSKGIEKRSFVLTYD